MESYEKGIRESVKKFSAELNGQPEKAGHFEALTWEQVLPRALTILSPENETSMQAKAVAMGELQRMAMIADQAANSSLVNRDLRTTCKTIKELLEKSNL